MDWQVGIARRAITPQTAVWLAGYGTRRPPDGKIHDLWVKVLALKDSEGQRVVMATTDHMGMSKTLYESLYGKVHDGFGLDRAQFMITFSHNHCGPVLKDDLVDYYPLDDDQRRLVDEYSEWMIGQVVDAVAEALSAFRPARLARGEGRCTFAVNRRENSEAEVPGCLPPASPCAEWWTTTSRCSRSKLKTSRFWACSLATRAIRPRSPSTRGAATTRALRRCTWRPTIPAPR
jgi:neutral ceramidase